MRAGIDDAKKEIVYYDDVDISIAVATPKGLVTPVLRDCGKMSFADVEKEIAAYGEKARQGKVRASRCALAGARSLSLSRSLD